LHALSSVLHPCRPDLSINDTPTTQIYTLSLHDALPISVFPTTTRTDPPQHRRKGPPRDATAPQWLHASTRVAPPYLIDLSASNRSEEHTSELQSRENLVCRLLLEKKKNKRTRR